MTEERRETTQRARSQRPLCRGLGWLWLVVIWLAWSAPAHAQQTPPQQTPQQQGSSTAFQLQQFRPSLDPNGMFQTHGADTLGQWAFQIGAAFNYAWSPLFLVAEGSNQQVDVINHQIGMDLAFGLGLLPFLDVTIVMPMTLYQVGQLPQLDILGSASGRSLTGFALGDLKIRAKLQILNQQIQGISLGLQVGLGIPSGNDETFNGEDTISFQLAALLSGVFGRFDFSINFGYRYLPETSFLGLIIGHELFYNAALAVAVVPQRFDVIAELNGIIGMSGGPDRINSPMGALIGGRFYPAGNRLVAIQLGVGIGILKGYGSPGFRVFAGLVFYPATGRRTRETGSDRDGDGIFDQDDRCPGQPGPKEYKGCPPPDTDRDGIPDKLDKCPRRPGPKSNQGCPQGGTAPSNDTDGDGIPNAADKCPNAAGPRSNNGCPKDDRDGDGTPDKLDKCPNVAGPRSNGGCPMPDTDGDGLADNIDQCPRRAGPPSNKGCPLGVVLPSRRPPPIRQTGPSLSNRDRDGDGVPDKIDRCPGLPGSRRRRGCPRRVYIKMSVRKRRIYLRKRLRFYRKRPRRMTRRVMRQVARLMKSFPTMKIRITATTFSRSRRRWVRARSWIHARSLRNYLHKRGISRKRISIRGRRRYRRRGRTRTYYRIDIKRF